MMMGSGLEKSTGKLLGVGGHQHVHELPQEQAGQDPTPIGSVTTKITTQWFRL